MSNEQHGLATPDVTEAAQRMMALSQRALALSPKMQERMVAQATGGAKPRMSPWGAGRPVQTSLY